MKKITYKIKNGLVDFMINDIWVASFRATNEVEKDAHIRAFVLGLRWARSAEFDPVTVEIKP